MARPRITSYAQHGEDVVLLRAFRHRPRGFYVDVGAAGPVQHSVTKLFYDRGWHGINVEPIPRMHQRLSLARPRDVNLRLAVGAVARQTEFYVFPKRPGLTTADRAIAERHRQTGFELERITIDTQPLDHILERHCRRPIDFLKIDVEGLEGEVLSSIDLARWAPKALVVEATLPRSSEPSHHEWEPALLDAGYRLALFDGLNRFYARAEERQLLARLSIPADAIDDYDVAEISKRKSRMPAAVPQRSPVPLDDAIAA